MNFFGKKPVSIDEAKITTLMTRGVEDVFVRENLLKKLRSGKRLRIKLGIDPTSPDLHLGHGVVLRKLREFQNLGHTIVLIIGDFTASIGDPSGRDKTRPPLTREEIRNNLKDYLRQAGKIINIKQTEVRYNSEWLSKLHGYELSKILTQVSVNQILEREDFHNRYVNHNSIRIYELLYPVMQAYDSIAVRADVECGGTDQTFNLLMGRFLMERNNLIPQDTLTVTIIEGLDGVKKMSKSLDNYIGLTGEPNDMFGKIMSLKDELIEKYFLLCTDKTDDELKTIHTRLTSGANPRDIKMELGEAIVAIYHNTSSAKKAREHFVNTFKKGILPDDAATISIKEGAQLSDALIQATVVSSKSEFRRLIDEGAITIMESQEKITDPHYIVSKPINIKVGKRRFAKIGFIPTSE